MLGGPERVENKLEGLVEEIVEAARAIALENQDWSKWFDNTERLKVAKKALYDYIAEIEAKCTYHPSASS